MVSATRVVIPNVLHEGFNTDGHSFRWLYDDRYADEVETVEGIIFKGESMHAEFIETLWTKILKRSIRPERHRFE